MPGCTLNDAQYEYKQKVFKCETCKDFFCEFCIESCHLNHEVSSISE